MFLTLAGIGLTGCGAGGTSKSTASHKVQQAWAQTGETSAQVGQPSAQASDASQAREPRSASELTARASERAGRGDYAGALEDTEAAIRIRGNLPVLSMMRCMLNERMNAQAPLACYADVVKLYASAGTQCESDLNCVVAASMASLPEAQGYRRHFLDAPRAAADQEITDVVLKGFTREKYLHSILP